MFEKRQMPDKNPTCTDSLFSYKLQFIIIYVPSLYRI